MNYLFIGTGIAGIAFLYSLYRSLRTHDAFVRSIKNGTYKSPPLPPVNFQTFAPYNEESSHTPWDNNSIPAGP